MKTRHTTELAPARHSFSEGGFLSLCISLGMFVFFVGILVALFAKPLINTAASPSSATTPITIYEKETHCSIRNPTYEKAH